MSHDVIKEPWLVTDEVTVWHGDCLDVLRTLPDASVDAVITDPPYGIGFMGKEWDGVAIRAAAAKDRDSRRSLGPESATRPGREKARSSSAYGNEAIIAGPVRGGKDFQDWCEQWARECLRVLKPGGHMLAFGGSRTWHRLASAVEDVGFEIRDSIAWLYGSGFPKSLNLDGEWDGWGTALKPAFEPIVVGRKPLAGTVAANALAHGTGALNIDASRVHTAGSEAKAYTVKRLKPGATLNREGGNWRPTDEDAPEFEGQTKDGRWPTNVLLDESQAASLDEQTGVLTSGLMKARTNREPRKGGVIYGADKRNITAGDTYADSGGGSRFFPTFRYEAKAPTSERPVDGDVQHPTVKPLDLMRWLVRLVTPPNGLILEPFAGSGTTVEAALLEGFRCIAIEREADYLPLIKQRISKPLQQSLFGDWEDAS